MSNSDAVDDDIQVSEQNFTKLTDIHHKSGFKDGISDGREQKYQEGFDGGFRDGFHHAFLVGKYKAMLDVKQQKTENDPKDSNSDLLLKNPNLGHCQICLDPTLIEKDLSDLIGITKSHTEKIHSKIEEKYKPSGEG
ncbi:hypothetical protein DMENIID0001_078680 [Sergentomyia squamirostris]